MIQKLCGLFQQQDDMLLKLAFCEPIWRSLTISDLMRSTTSDEILDARVYSDRARSLHSMARYSSPANVTAATLVALGLWATGGSFWLGIWASIPALMLVYQIGLDRAYIAADPTERGHPRWERRFASTCLLLGLVWSALPLFLMPESATLRTIVVLVILGLSAATVSGYGHSARVFFSFAAPPILGVSIAYGQRGGAENLTLAGLALIYLLFLCGVQRILAKHFVEQVVAQVSSERLVARLQRTEANLEKSLAEHRLLFDLATVGIAEIHEGRIVRANKHLGQLVGRRLDELVGQPVSTLYPEEGGANGIDSLHEILSRGTGTEVDVQMRRGDGRSIWVAMTCRNLDAGVDTRGLIAVFNDISDRREREVAMRRLAHEDALTGLPNRRMLDERLRQALRRAEQDEHCVALLLLDLDGFKRINDRHGHEAGDHVLAVVARRLLESVTPSDTVSRLGGDEFVVLLDHQRQAVDVERIACELIDQVSTPISFGGKMLRVGASVGISLAPRDGFDADVLLRCADGAMYRAKTARGASRYASTDFVPMPSLTVS